MEMVELSVHMDCNGCEKTVRRALCKLKGVESVEVDRSMNKVTVMGFVDRKTVLKAVRRTGKRAEFWQYNSQSYLGNLGNGTSGRSSSSSSYSYGVGYNMNPQAFARTYNYEHHGYNNNLMSEGSMRHNGSNNMLLRAPSNDGITTLFSDEQPNSCSVM